MALIQIAAPQKLYDEYANKGQKNYWYS